MLHFILSSSTPATFHNQAQLHLSPHWGYRLFFLENVVESKRFVEAQMYCLFQACVPTQKKLQCNFNH
jgi:hypothetical protein